MASAVQMVTLWFDDVIMCCLHIGNCCDISIIFVISQIDIMAMDTLTPEEHMYVS